MYTFNILCFGHEMAKDKQLNNELNDWDIEFSMKINDRMWEVDFPYHGGQVRNDCYSCVFGIQIAYDDNNPNYIDEIRSAREEDYIDDYNKFLHNLLECLDAEIADCHEKEFKLTVVKLKSFVKNNKPKFYSVEASS